MDFNNTTNMQKSWKQLALLYLSILISYKIFTLLHANTFCSLINDNVFMKTDGALLIILIVNVYIFNHLAQDLGLWLALLLTGGFRSQWRMMIYITLSPSYLKTLSTQFRSYKLDANFHRAQTYQTTSHPNLQICRSCAAGWCCSQCLMMSRVCSTASGCFGNQSQKFKKCHSEMTLMLKPSCQRMVKNVSLLNYLLTSTKDGDASGKYVLESLLSRTLWKWDTRVIVLAIWKHKVVITVDLTLILDWTTKATFLINFFWWRTTQCTSDIICRW